MAAAFTEFLIFVAYIYYIVILNLSISWSKALKKSKDAVSFSNIYLYNVQFPTVWSNQIVTVQKPHVMTNSEEMKTFARHEYGRVRVFKIKMRSLVHKL